MRNVNRIISIIFAIVALAMSYVYAIPTEPFGAQNITRGTSTRTAESNFPPTIVEAEAGNITQLTISALSVTQTWQGYYGEISGTITLDDANNFTMYDWIEAEPQGEIYAASQTVSNWETVHCFNYTNNGTAHNYTYDGGTKQTYTTTVLNLTELESGSLAWSLGLQSGDGDGVDETFNASGSIIVAKDENGGLTYENHTEFFVGTITINQSSCPATNTYEANCMNKTSSKQEDWFKVDDSNCVEGQGVFFWDGSADGNNFQEVLLTVNDSETIIYTTIIENRGENNETDPIGFDNSTHDFQMLVGDDGHAGGGQDVTTDYYFYVELQ